MMDAFSRLPAIAADPARADRVRARCHGVLAARRASLERSRRRAAFWKRVVAPALVGGFCIIYICAVIVDALGVVRPHA
jgi:hypothetical protein